MAEEKKDKAVEEREKALDKREEDIAAREIEVDGLRVWLDGKEKELEAREKALAGKTTSVSQAEPEEKPLTKDEQKLIEDGCKAYGIPQEHLFHFRIDPRTKEAVLVTAGGKKVRYARGMEVEKLDPVAVDGISRKKPRHVMGKKK